MDATREKERSLAILKDGKWHCRNCEISLLILPEEIQDLKEMGDTKANMLIGEDLSAIREVQD